MDLVQSKHMSYWPLKNKFINKVEVAPGSFLSGTMGLTYLSVGW